MICEQHLDIKGSKMMMLHSSSKRKTSHCSCITEEIVSDILSRLPVKSLKRFQCVCKPWNDLIPEIDTNRFRLLYSPLLANPNPLLSIDYEALNKGNDGVAITKLQCPDVVKRNTSLKFLGSCNGLVCLEMEEQDGIVLWNPSTRETKLFSKPPPIGNESQFYGFGYDPSTEDYKVMMGHSDHMKTVIEVFSVKRNTWRAHMDLCCVDLSFHDQGCFLNGALHWIKLGYMSSSIISFDLAQESFMETVPLPHCEPGDTKDLTSLGIGTTRNCLFVHSGPDTSDFNIWVMKEFGVRESWTKVLNIPSEIIGRKHGHGEHCLKPLCILHSGEVLMEHDGNRLVLYNPQVMTFRKIIKEDKDHSPIETVAYIETLVSPVM